MPDIDTTRIMSALGASRVFVCSDEDYGGWGTWKSIRPIPIETFIENVYDVKYSAGFPYPIGSIMDLFCWLHGKLRSMVRQMVARPEDTELLIIQKPKIDDTELRNRRGRRISISARVGFEPIQQHITMLHFEEGDIRAYVRWMQTQTALTMALCPKYERKKPSQKAIEWEERWHKR